MTEFSFLGKLSLEDVFVFPFVTDFYEVIVFLLILEISFFKFGL